MSEIIYPNIPHDERKNVKLKLSDIEAIQHLFHIEKWTIPQIADRFKVTQSSIKYHLDPEYRQKHLDMSSQYNGKRWRTDEEYRKKTKKYTRNWIDERIKNNIDFKNWLKNCAFIWQEKNSTKIKEQHAVLRAIPANKEKHRINQSEIRKTPEGKAYMKNYSSRPEVKERNKENYQKNKETIRQRHREDYQKNKENVLKRQKEYNSRPEVRERVRTLERIKFAMRWF